MPALGVNFDARQVPPAEAGMPVWEGPVLHQITRTEIQDTSAKDGSRMLALFVTAMDGHYHGQENVIRLNLWNKNPKASEIASRQLSSICHVTNRLQVSDSDQLRGAAFVGVWAKENRKVQDQQTGQERDIESCQCKDFRMADGRTIKEVIAGQPAAAPYVPQHAGMQQQPGGHAQGPQPGPQAGFQPPTPQPGGAPSPMGAGGAFGGAPAPSGGPQGSAGGPGFGTAASPSSGGPGPGPGFGGGAPGGFGAGPAPGQGGPQGGFGGAPGGPQPQGGFQPQGGAPGGFGGAPAGGAPGGFGGGAPGQAGPWGQQ